MSWFEPHIVYEGYGRAEFENPKGYVEGPFRIEFDEAGNSIIELVRVERFVNEAALSSDFDLEYLLTGIAPRKFGSGWMGPGLPYRIRNSCTKLEVKIETPKGHFVCLSNIIHYPMGVLPFPGPFSVLFDAKLSEFTCTDIQEEVKYWVLPLINFVTDFVQLETTRPPHPLRIDPSKPLILFNFNGASGFIDQVENYDNNKQRLSNGEALMLSTAIMVGAVNGQGTTYDQIEAWLPFDFLESVLSLCAGSRVTAAWIEFRAVDGKLIKRLHIPTRKTVFQKGHAAIGGIHTGGIGDLLSSCQTSRHFRNRALRIVMNELVEAGHEIRTIEDRLSLAFRAFEALAKLLNIKAPTAKSLLPKDRYKEIKRILQDTQSQIANVAESIGNDAKSGGSLSADEQQQLQTEKELIERIANRAECPLDFKLRFEEAVFEIADKLGFADADVVLQKFKNDREWGKFASQHRNSVMHGYSFMDEARLWAAWRFLCHLQDLGIRSVLRLLEYKGNYCPVVKITAEANVSIDESLDWVTSARRPEDLGYL